MNHDKRILLELQNLKSPEKQVAMRAIKLLGIIGENALPIEDTLQSSKDEELITMAIIAVSETGNQASINMGINKVEKEHVK